MIILVYKLNAVTENKFYQGSIFYKLNYAIKIFLVFNLLLKIVVLLLSQLFGVSHIAENDSKNNSGQVSDRIVKCTF